VIVLRSECIEEKYIYFIILFPLAELRNQRGEFGAEDSRGDDKGLVFKIRGEDCSVRDLSALEALAVSSDFCEKLEGNWFECNHLQATVTPPIFATPDFRHSA